MGGQAPSREMTHGAENWGLHQVTCEVPKEVIQGEDRGIQSMMGQGPQGWSYLQIPHPC